MYIFNYLVAKLSKFIERFPATLRNEQQRTVGSQQPFLWFRLVWKDNELCLSVDYLEPDYRGPKIDKKHLVISGFAFQIKIHFMSGMEDAAVTLFVPGIDNDQAVSLLALLHHQIKSARFEKPIEFKNLRNRLTKTQCEGFLGTKHLFLGEKPPSTTQDASTSTGVTRKSVQRENVGQERDRDVVSEHMIPIVHAAKRRREEPRRLSETRITTTYIDVTSNPGQRSEIVCRRTEGYSHIDTSVFMKTFKPVLTSFLKGNVLSCNVLFFTSEDGLYMTIVPEDRLNSIRHEFRGSALVSSLLQTRNQRMRMNASEISDLYTHLLPDCIMRDRQIIFIIDFMRRLYSDAVKRQFPGGF
jgi:hypothetical protein